MMMNEIKNHIAILMNAIRNHTILLMKEVKKKHAIKYNYYYLHSLYKFLFFYCSSEGRAGIRLLK